MVTFYKKYGIHEPDINKRDDVIFETNINCRIICFHSVECSYVCDFEFTNITNKEVVNKKLRGIYGDKINKRIKNSKI